MPLRTDGLPQPVTITDDYLAAILDELRAQRAPVAPNTPQPPVGEERVKEPQQAPEPVEEPEAEMPQRPDTKKRRR